MTRPLAVLLLATAVAVPRGLAQAPAPEPVRLTLADAVARARASSPRIDELRAARQGAEAGLRGARAGRLPTVELQASYTRHSDVPELVIALPGLAPRTVFPNIPNTYRTRAELSLPLYTGGRVSAAIESARHGRDAADRDVEAGLGDLVLETVTAYWSLVAARESERVLAESIASYESHLKQARDRQDAGMAARSEVLAVQVERDRAELARLQAHNDAMVANDDLARLLGLDRGARVEPTEPVAAPAPADETAEALVAKALEARPELAGLRARAAAADADVRAAGSARRPQASLTAGYDYARPNPRLLPLEDAWNDTWSVGLNLSLLAFDGGRTSAAVAQARARAEAARRRLEDAQRRVRLEVASRLHLLATSRAALAVAERSVEAAREDVRVSQDRYREGLVPASELLDAQSRLLRAGLDRTRPATQVQQARADLDRAVGR